MIYTCGMSQIELKELKNVDGRKLWQFEITVMGDYGTTIYQGADLETPWFWKPSKVASELVGWAIHDLGEDCIQYFDVNFEDMTGIIKESVQG